MKKLRLLGLCLLVAVAAFTLTSCLNNDDDNNGLTPEQQYECFLAVQGSHSGKLIYASGTTSEGKVKADTLNASWYINSDSTMTFREIPSKVIASCIDTTTTEHKAVREAIANEAPQAMECKIYFLKNNPVLWYIMPVNLTYNVTYGGQSHKIRIVFYTDYSYGTYRSESGIAMQLATYGAYIDGEQDSSSNPLVKATAFLFVGK